LGCNATANRAIRQTVYDAPRLVLSLKPLVHQQSACRGSLVRVDLHDVTDETHILNCYSSGSVSLKGRLSSAETILATYHRAHCPPAERTISGGKGLKNLSIILSAARSRCSPWVLGGGVKMCIFGPTTRPVIYTNQQAQYMKMGQLMTHHSSERLYIYWRAPPQPKECFRAPEKARSYVPPGNGGKQAHSCSCAEIGQLDSC
jgi:hypothetical protein